VGELKEVLANCRVSGWARSLAIGPDLDAQETLMFLDRAFDHLPHAAQRRALRRLNQADRDGVEAILHELLIFEVCYGFHVAPEYEPDLQNQRPDLALTVAGQTYLADVFLTNRPLRTMRRIAGLSGYRDRGEAAKKIADRISEKAVRYRTFEAPLILFVVLMHHNVHTDDLEAAIYGDTVNELCSSGGLTTQCHEGWHHHGAFCPPGPNAPHREISAVIACDWFDTLERRRPGRRLHCVVYHHWWPSVVLPVGSFGRFQDVFWPRSESGLFIPNINGPRNFVMSTTSCQPEWAPYSASQPW